MSKDSNNRSSLVMALGLVALLLFSANFVSYLSQWFGRTPCEKTRLVEAIQVRPAPSSPVLHEEQDRQRYEHRQKAEPEHVSPEKSSHRPQYTPDRPPGYGVPGRPLQLLYSIYIILPTFETIYLALP